MRSKASFTSVKTHSPRSMMAIKAGFRPKKLLNFSKASLSWDTSFPMTNKASLPFQLPLQALTSRATRSLSPESISALKAARDNVLQKSVNLALGSALATIGLTIPTVAAISLATGVTVILGLGQRETLLLALTLFVSAVTFAAERTNVLFGLVHLVIFACWLFLVFVP